MLNKISILFATLAVSLPSVYSAVAHSGYCTSCILTSKRFCAADNNCYNDPADTCPGGSFLADASLCMIEVPAEKHVACEQVTALAHDSVEHPVTFTMNAYKSCSFNLTGEGSYATVTFTD